MVRKLWFLALCLLSLASAPGRAAAAEEAVLLEVEGVIGPATADYLLRGLAVAAERDAQLVVLRLDTPGGLDSSMRQMVRAILASPVPVVSYVAPGGARAASAGTYLMYASHVAAMAPATNLGAATPVRLGGLPAAPEEQGGDEPGQQPGTAMERKLVNDAVAYIRSLAQLRGRNADWAEQAVREGRSLSALAAADQAVIDLVAPDLERLLLALDGREVRLDGRVVSLDTEALALVELEPDWRNRLLAVLTNPNVAYILMLVGIYGLIFELATPGAIGPGVVGAICLLLALFGFQALPINYAGLGLMLLGLGCIAAEAFLPSFGVLGLGGMAAFVIGSIMLLDTGLEAYEISLALIGGFTVASLLLLLATAWLALRSRRGVMRTGAEQLVGAEAVSTEAFAESGWVRLHGELWRARSGVPVAAGQRLRVVALHGLEVEVEPL